MAGKVKASKIKLPQGVLFRILSTVIDVLITLTAAIVIYVATKQRLKIDGVNIEANCSCTDFEAIPWEGVKVAKDTTKYLTIALIAVYGILAAIVFIINIILFSLPNKCECHKPKLPENWYKLGLISFLQKHIPPTIPVILHGLLSIVAGVIYLLGDNWASAFCDDMNTGSGTDTVTLCGSVISNVNAAQVRTMASKGAQCEKVGSDILIAALVLNLIIHILEKGNFGASKAWPSYNFGTNHSYWVTLLDWLQYVPALDQALTTYINFVLDTNKKVTMPCPATIHGGSATLYVLFVLLTLAVVSWTLIGASFKFYKEKKTCKNMINIILLYCIGIAIIAFFGMYIFADVPWPWSCQEACTSEGYQSVRVILLALSMALIVVLVSVYLFVIAIPSLYLHWKGPPFLNTKMTVNKTITGTAVAVLNKANSKSTRLEITKDNEVFEDDGIIIKASLGNDLENLSSNMSLSQKDPIKWWEVYRCCNKPTEVEDRLDSVKEESELHWGSMVCVSPAKELTFVAIEGHIEESKLKDSLSKLTSSPIHVGPKHFLKEETDTKF